MTGDMVEDAQGATADRHDMETNNILYALKLTDEGAKIFGEVTS